MDSVYPARTLPGRTQGNACQSCRQRKLKCDKRQPCTNCNDWSVECNQQLLPPVNGRIKRPRNESDSSTISNILSRLDQIEACINKRQQNDNDNTVSPSIENQLMKIRNSVPTLPFGDDTPSTDISTHSIPAEDAERLVQISANDNVLHNALMHHLSISISADSQVQQYTDSHEIRLPPKWDTLHLLQVYFDYIGQFQHIIYEPHLRNLIEEVYYQISFESTTTAPRGLALILAVIAIATILQPLNGNLETALPVISERVKICAIHIRSAMDCLEQHRRRMSQTLENVQAMIILYFLINHIEAFSPRSRALLTEAVTVSQSLGLHRIDSTNAKGVSSQDTTDPITEEMKRRVWWYLTATEWMVSIAGGPLDAVYLIQPKLTTTRIPRHINDDDLSNPNIKQRPHSEPTTMSYVLQRLKLAETARCISDEVSHSPNTATCETILSLDSKLETLIQTLPAFFRLEIADLEQNRRTDQTHPYIPLQRLMVNLMINLVRCKLHFPYLLGNSSKSLHVLSRHAGVKAARQALSTLQAMAAADMAHSADFMKIQGTVVHMFIGALILAADLCCNPSTPGDHDRDRQLSELSAALKHLDDVKHQSQVAAKFLEELTQLLVKHGVWPPSTTTSATTEPVSVSNVDLFRNGQLGEESFETSLPFDDLWETFVERSSAVDTTDMW